jgi:uncharacterized protein (DUF433 family)
MLDWARCDAVERASNRLSGAWTFKGTRVPVKALFENLEDGATVEQFLQWFPGVTRGQVEAVLEHTGTKPDRGLIERGCGYFSIKERRPHCKPLLLAITSRRRTSSGGRR